MIVCISTALVFINLFPQPTAHQEPSTDELETVTGESSTNKEGVGKDPNGKAVRNGSHLVFWDKLLVCEVMWSDLSKWVCSMEAIYTNPACRCSRPYLVSDL